MTKKVDIFNSPMSGVLDSVLAKLGLNVRKRREARELTQEKLAERAGLDSTYISGIERSLRNPGIKNVAKLNATIA